MGGVQEVVLEINKLKGYLESLNHENKRINYHPDIRIVYDQVRRIWSDMPDFGEPLNEREPINELKRRVAIEVMPGVPQVVAQAIKAFQTELRNLLIDVYRESGI